MPPLEIPMSKIVELKETAQDGQKHLPVFTTQISRCRWKHHNFIYKNLVRTKEKEETISN